ncbi:cytidylate kinase-like family protein [bacterium]|nr:cytidylate kinase-like family protein [bacterium]
MSIITISKGTYTWGKEVAEKVSKKLNYKCIAREVILEASQEFNITEIKLVRVIHDAPSILDCFTYGKEKYIAYFQAAFLNLLAQDNTVYHGLAGHFFLKGVSHVLKVRIIADKVDRVKLVMDREGVDEKLALQILDKDDEERKKWSLHLYGINTTNPNLYDLVIRIKKISVDQAVDIICSTVKLKSFQTNQELQQRLADLILAANVKAALVDLKPDTIVTSKKGIVNLFIKSGTFHEGKLVESLTEKAKGIPVVIDIKVNMKASHI